MLIGKRFEYSTGNAAGTKTGTIASEPFPQNDGDGGYHCTCVAVLWDDGSMGGAIDVDYLRIVEKDEGYVVCTTWPDGAGEMVIAVSPLAESTFEHAQGLASRLKDKSPRIMRLTEV